MLWEAVEGSFVHGMPEAIPSFPRILGSAGRQLFDGMPLVIPSFVDVVGLEGSFFIECHR